MQDLRSSYAPSGRLFWEEETKWIEAASNPATQQGGEFTGPWRTYCDMQARFADVEHFHDLAERIRKVREARS